MKEIIFVFDWRLSILIEDLSLKRWKYINQEYHHEIIFFFKEKRISHIWFDTIENILFVFYFCTSACKKGLEHCNASIRNESMNWVIFPHRVWVVRYHKLLFWWNDSIIHMRGVQRYEIFILRPWARAGLVII